MKRFAKACPYKVLLRVKGSRRREERRVSEGGESNTERRSLPHRDFDPNSTSILIATVIVTMIRMSCANGTYQYRIW
eukprot:2182264-Pleurochrysis_carterae.AAC.1